MNAPAPKPVEFKGTSLSVVSVVLRSISAPVLEAAIAAMPGGKRRFFDGDAAVLDLAAVADDTADWAAVLGLLRDYGLQPVGVCGANAALLRGAGSAGLPVLAAEELARPTRKAVAEKAAPADAAAPTLIVDKPLRSGQRIYARGGDLVLTAMVSAGAEVIADGSIHVYAPLRGKALAGATGNAGARVWCTCFAAELVSVAGVYRTFEQGLPPELDQKPVQVRLDGEEGQQKLHIAPLALR
ncbi:MAG: septum site-determining protein MinC [Rhodocyclaceae bacterium]|nr:septum site-determining protein MinC [Rhodocyclaceae bacterium]